ncbi:MULTISPECIES: hypothetical protein [unclassified Sutcliffiella]|uniref:hypothetical protein n=1 Tax=Sutcliffiella sp. FSL R7-0096 TaxID=2921670 RepID=UPI0030CD6F3D
MDHLGGDWVEVDVFADVDLVVDIMDEAGFESAFQEVAGESVFAVDVLGVFGVDCLHDQADVGGFGFDEQVGVVGHETVGVQFERVFEFRFKEDALIGLVVLGLKEDDAAAVSAGGDVVLGSWEPDSWVSWHSGRYSFRGGGILDVCGWFGWEMGLVVLRDASTVMVEIL